MTSKRPPRRDPRAEDEQAPPADDLGARRARPPTRPGTPPTGPTDNEFELLRSRYAEAETKRRRAEALADGLAQRVASLEAELRVRAPTGSDDSRRRLELRISELEGQLEQSRAQLDNARAALSTAEAVNAERDETVSTARGRADAAEEALSRLEERLAQEEQQKSTSAETQARLEARVATLEGQLASVREDANEASVRHSSSSIELEGKLAEIEERAKKAEEARSAESTSATEARAKLASMASKASEAAMKVSSLTEELARSKSEWDAQRTELESVARTHEAAARTHEASARALEGEKSELAAKLATATAKLASGESKLSTLQSMATELDQALQRERTRAAEIEAGQRRVQTAAMSSAREVLARLERHEEKLSALRKDALNRAISLIDEAGGLHGQKAPDSGRLTPSVPSSRPVIAVAKATAAETAPGAPRPQRGAKDAAYASAVGTSGDTSTPMQGTPRQTNPRRTMQGLSALPRGAFGGTDTVSPTSPLPSKPDDGSKSSSDDPDIEISVDDES